MLVAVTTIPQEKLTLTHALSYQWCSTGNNLSSGDWNANLTITGQQLSHFSQTQKAKDLILGGGVMFTFIFINSIFFVKYLTYAPS